jgi:hypothetical protein
MASDPIRSRSCRYAAYAADDIAILQSLVSQLGQMGFRQKDRMLAILLRAFRMRKFQTDSKRSGFSWKWEDLWSTLTEILCSLELDTKVFIIVDALDECDEASKSGINSLYSILSSLMDEQFMPTLKVMLTCRQIDLTLNDSSENPSTKAGGIEIRTLSEHQKLSYLRNI